MKETKVIKKLELKKTTVSRLTGAAMEKVVGALDTLAMTCGITCAYSCGYTCGEVTCNTCQTCFGDTCQYPCLPE